MFSAHLDHLGIGAPVDGDTIRNGALDNALGVAIVLEIARAAARRARRTATLAAVRRADRRGTGPARRAMVRDASAAAAGRRRQPRHADAAGAHARRGPIGASHSTCRRALRAGRRRRCTSACRPIRSRRRRCSCAATSSRSCAPACRRCTWMAAWCPARPAPASPPTRHTLPKLAQREFLRHCYHQPCDDIRQPIQYGDAARMARLNAELARRSAQRRERAALEPRRFLRHALRTDRAVRRDEPRPGRYHRPHEQPAFRRPPAASNTSRPTRATCRSTPRRSSSSRGTSYTATDHEVWAHAVRAPARDAGKAAPATSSWTARTRWA